MIIKPLLAHTVEDLNTVQLPCVVSVKLDGIRALKIGGQIVSRSLKPIRNKHIQESLKHLPDGIDGELVLRNWKAPFNEVSSAIMSEDGTPDFMYVIFDKFDIEGGFEHRYDTLYDQLQPFISNTVEILDQMNISSIEELIAFENTICVQGFEGIMVRSLQGKYKQGRSTAKEGILGKVKRFEDSEAEIIGFVEQMTNTNEKLKDNLGHAKRSSHQENMIPANTLGTLILRDVNGKFTETFEIGTGIGLTQEYRKYIWDHQERFIGKLIKYKYQPHGTKDRPRIPVWLGMRHMDDVPFMFDGLDIDYDEFMSDLIQLNKENN